MRRTSSWLSWFSVVSLGVAGCSGGAGSTSSTSARNGTNTVTVATHGPVVNVNRSAPTSASHDAAPTLVTVRGRGGSRATSLSTPPATPTASPVVTTTASTATPSTTAAMPAEGGYIVRGAGTVARAGDTRAVPGDRGASPPVTIATPSANGTLAAASTTSVGHGRSGPGLAQAGVRPRTTATTGSSGGGGEAAGNMASAPTARHHDGTRRMESMAAADEAEMPAPSPHGGSAGAPAVAPMPMQRMPVRPPPPPTTVTITVTTPPPVVVAPVVIEEQQAPANLLTAASVGDADRRDNYLGYLSRHGGEAETLGLDMSRRVRFRVVDAQGRPVNDAQIALSGEGLQAVAHTHSDGTWDFFPSVAANGFAGRASAHVSVENVAIDAQFDVPPAGDGPNVVVQLPAVVNPAPTALDLQFLIDVTGSMGDELRYVNREVASIVQRIEAASPGTHVRVGATFYRDRTDQLVVQQIPFTTNVGGFATTMQQVVASGGGDYPEDMNAGLEAALTGMEWSEGPASRVLVVIADAPPQPYADENYNWTQAMNDASRRGIRLLPVAASGSDRNVEFLFRAMGSMTTTPYVYLTDESGIGAPHMEADTDRVAVERFNDLLTRLVISDLRGEGMHEPVPSHI